MNRASAPTGWVRNPVMRLPELDPRQASSYALGWTWNPCTGCRNHVDGMCKGGGFPCYAYRLANTRLRDTYLANPVVAAGAKDWDTMVEAQYHDPFYPRFWLKRLTEMVWQQGTKPKGIFVCDMGELFGDSIPEQWQHRIFSAIRVNPQHRFYLLTKQPQNLMKFSPFPDNVYLGVTVCNQQMFIDAIHYLVRVKAKVKFLSFEPLLSEIPMTPEQLKAGCNWLIIGGLSGKQRFYPPEEWIQEIETAADKARIPVFEKNNLKPLLQRELIQEMPE